jgi:hypothetical protein
MRSAVAAWIPHAGPGASSESMPAGKPIVKRGWLQCRFRRMHLPIAKHLLGCTIHTSAGLAPCRPQRTRYCCTDHTGWIPAPLDTLPGAVEGYSFLPLVLLFCFGPYGGIGNSSR